MTSETIVLGDDMVIVVPFSKHIIVVEGHGWTYDGNGNADTGTAAGNSTHFFRTLTFTLTATRVRMEWISAVLTGLFFN